MKLGIKNVDNVDNLVYNCTFSGFVVNFCVDIKVYNRMCISRNFVNCVIFLYNLSSDIILIMTTAPRFLLFLIFLRKRSPLPFPGRYEIQ